MPKSPGIAFALSFFLPGAGLAYLGKWKAGVINLLLVLLLGVIVALLAPEDFVERALRYLSFGVAGGSAAFAQQQAKAHNLALANRSAAP